MVRFTSRLAVLTICFYVFLGLPVFGQYMQGPRGGCYTVTKSGNKRYVDRSLCTPKTASKPAAPGTQTPTMPSSGQTGARKYITGPRGGCYYVTASGRKQYVDHSMCK